MPGIHNIHIVHKRWGGEILGAFTLKKDLNKALKEAGLEEYEYEVTTVPDGKLKEDADVDY